MISPSSLSACKVGFIGCGTIAAAIATGLATVDYDDEDEPVVESMAISRRSQTKSDTLKERFPDLVTVYDNNQDILDQADIVFITVLPQQASEVLQSLKFDLERHHLVSLVVRYSRSCVTKGWLCLLFRLSYLQLHSALPCTLFRSQSTATLNDLIAYSGLDASQVSKMICLPSIANHQGVCLHCCPIPNETLTSLFRRTSSVVTLSNEAEMEAAMVTTCLMGPTYGIMREGRDWLLKHTQLSAKEASYLIIQQYIGFIQDAEHESDTNPNRLDDLIAEQTKGGLNEQGLANLDRLGGLEAHRRVMDATLSRIRGDTDGTIGG